MAVKPKLNNLLFINGFWTPTNIIDELLSNVQTDSNIFLTFPLGIMTIAGCCRQAFPSLEIKVVDFMMELHKVFNTPEKAKTDFDSFVSKTLLNTCFTPDIIGISLGSSNGHMPNQRLIRICKQIWPGSQIVAGGMHATAFTHRIIQNLDIDYIIRGPGDIAFTELLGHLMEKRDPKHIPGVVTGLDTISSMAVPIKDLNSLPMYPYDLIDMEYLLVNDATAPIVRNGARTAMVITSRGCPFGCTYCAANQIHGKKVQFYDIDRVISEISYLIQTYNVNQICIIDDLFGADKKFFFDFFKTVDTLKLKFNIVIPAGLSLRIYDEKMIDVLVEHGMDAVYFPLESGSQHVQDNVIKKGINLGKAARLITYAKNKNIFTGVNIVIGSPGETREMMLETREFLKNLPVDWVAFFSAYPYPGTEMTRILLERGDINEDQLIDLWDNSTQGFKKRSFDTKEIKGEELADLVYDFNIGLNFFNNYNIRINNFSHVIPKLDKIIERYPFHVVAIVCRAKCYYNQGLKDQALGDLKMISTLIHQNRESLKMFEKYKATIFDFLGAQIAESGFQNDFGVPDETL
jgi:radical SAM superfamily enzyme YgiQ (UPF0313 family)